MTLSWTFLNKETTYRTKNISSGYSSGGIEDSIIHEFVDILFLHYEVGHPA
jgi:hypothetical protein